MPLLKSKQCFGRIEYRIRHGHEDSGPFNQRGKMVPKVPKCAKCPIATKDSCTKLVAERIKASPETTAALQAWSKAGAEAEANSNPQTPGKRRYERFTGKPFGFIWQAVRYAIVNHGSFTNSNDAALQKQIEDTERKKLEKKRKDMRKRRKQERAELKFKNQPPPEHFIEAAWEEYDDRLDQLYTARSIAGLPRQVSTLTDEGCELTALSWLFSEIKRFQGLPTKAGQMAKWLEKKGLTYGRSYINLKDRLRRDIERAEEIENGLYGNIWQPFDPDADAHLALPI